MPMVTLVNRRSASASEIVSGALQDHDRSLIVGETTFGKALVQSVYRVAQNAGASITTAQLLHAERPADSASVGRQLRRVPDLHAARSGREQGAQARGPEADRRRPQGLQRRRRRAGLPPRRPGRRLQPDAVRPRHCQPRAVRHLRAALQRAAGDLRITPSTSSAGARPRRQTSRSPTRWSPSSRRLVQKSPVPFDEASWQKDLPFIRASSARRSTSTCSAWPSPTRTWRRAIRRCSSR